MEPNTELYRLLAGLLEYSTGRLSAARARRCLALARELQPAARSAPGGLRRLRGVHPAVPGWRRLLRPPSTSSPPAVHTSATTPWETTPSGACSWPSSRRSTAPAASKEDTSCPTTSRSCSASCRPRRRVAGSGDLVEFGLGPAFRKMAGASMKGEHRRLPSRQLLKC